jgi:hypothetical protein
MTKEAPDFDYSELGSDTPPQSEATKETEVVQLIREIESEFLRQLQAAYGESRGWRICGPAAIALSRIIATRLNIPLLHRGMGEHIHLDLGMFDPRNNPSVFGSLEPEEQTYILYDPGQEDIYYIDPIYGLLMEGQGMHRGEIIKVVKIPKTELPERLAADYALFPYLDWVGRNVSFLINKRAYFPDILGRYVEGLVAMHDERAFMETFITAEGNVYQSDWSKTQQIIKHFVPEWQPENDVFREEIKKVLRKLLGEPRLQHLPEQPRPLGRNRRLKGGKG